MESKKLNGYEIEFITKYEYCNLPMYEDRDWLNDKIYVGLVSDISEELAEKIVDNLISSSFKDTLIGLDTIYKHDGENINIYKNYIESNINIANMYTCKTTKQSFQTLSDLPYCIITKIKLEVICEKT